MVRYSQYMGAVKLVPTGSINVELTNRPARITKTYMLRDNADFSVLITRLITRVYGSAAAHSRRDDSYSKSEGLRRWDGIVLGRDLTITELKNPTTATA